MQTTDELVQEITVLKKKRKVTFSEDVIDNERPIIFYKKRKKEPNYDRMKKTALRYLSHDKYEELTVYLQSYTPQELDIFYRQKGGTLFSFAIIYFPTHMALKFLLDTIPSVITSNILSNNNFSILTRFLGSHSLAYQDEGFNQERKTEVIDKLKALLGFDSAEMHDALERIINASFISPNIKQCLELAKLQHKNENSKFCL
jgi:hypothetical protein